MCGIAGILEQGGLRPGFLVTIERMTAALRHRGPDGDGYWSDRRAGIVFGHRRLAIVDLSDTGRQPMQSQTGRYVITFNGEIYNFRLLRRELEQSGHAFRGSGDTEVLLAAIEKWGLERALLRCNGMFALALWDCKTRTLHLARDRIGKKPLYVARSSTAIVFASELKAFAAVPDLDREIDPSAVGALLARGWISDDACIWTNAFKIPPAGILSIHADAPYELPDAMTLRGQIRRWWSLPDTAYSGFASPFSDRLDDIVAELDLLLRAAVRDRMVADVPIGAFLSGGIDSSTVVALMQAQSDRPVRTFTIAFDEAAYDESDAAAAVANHLGTSHTELRLTSAEARAVIPTLPEIWDEPFADESQIPTLLVSQLARSQVTVALSGDGGDECFAGYSRYSFARRVAPLLAARPYLRTLGAAAISLLARAARGRWVGAMPLSPHLQRTLQGDRLPRVAQLLAHGKSGLYEDLTRLSAFRLALADEPARARTDTTLTDDVAELILNDMTDYLPGDILVKLDRASMAASLEGRCPLLDHRVIEFSWRVPTALKFADGRGKWPLRRVLAQYVPQSLFERPKRGFDVPVGDWLRGPLRAWACDLLSESQLRRQGLLDAAAVQACWNDHLNGRQDHARVLWAVLMLQAWLEKATAAPGNIHTQSPDRVLQGA
jgi:asparagine synthase (glutamine-hydrolysing)